MFGGSRFETKNLTSCRNHKRYLIKALTPKTSLMPYTDLFVCVMSAHL